MNQADQQLWKSWQGAGDDHAFETLVRPHVRFATDVARRMGCRPDEADDVVQESLAKLARERGEKPVRIGLRAWLARSVRLQALMLHRSSRRRRLREQTYAERRDVTEHPRRGTDDVEAALQQLTEAQREAVVLRYLHDLEYREVALVLGISENACRLRVHKAVSELRRRLGREPGTAVAALPILGGHQGPDALTAAALASTSTKVGSATFLGVLAMNKIFALSLTLVLVLGVAYVFVWKDDPDGRDVDQQPPVEEASLYEEREAAGEPALEPTPRPERPGPAGEEPTAKPEAPAPAATHAALIAKILAAGGKVALLSDGVGDYRRARWIEKPERLVEGVLVGIDIPTTAVAVLLEDGDVLAGVKVLRIQSDWRSRSSMTDDQFERLLGKVDLRELDVSRTRITNDGLAPVARQRNLRSLEIGNLGITNDGLRHVAGLMDLEELDFRDNKISNDGLVHLAGLTNLREIEFGETLITDAGFVHLKSLQLEKIVMRESREIAGKGVKHLDLTRLEEFDADEAGGVDDSVMEGLKDAPRLKKIVVKETRVSDKGLAHIADVRSLESLDLNDTKITSAGIANLVGLPALTRLNLAETAIDDDAIPHLSRMSQLKRLELRETRITKEGVARLREALPNCHVRDD